MIKSTEDFIQRNIVRASTTKQAQSRRKMLEKIERLEKPTEVAKVSFDFPFSKNLSQEVLMVKNLSIGYTKPILSPISFEVRYNQKVAIIGHNGVGKSTLLKTLLGEIPSFNGSYKFCSSADISYYRQEEMFPKLKPIDYVREFYPMLDDGAVRSLLAKVGLKSDSISKTMDILSGGEQTKVRLAIMMKKKANILVFDEPTNHLDVIAKEALYKAINEFEGTVILVSHDTEFYKDIVDFEINLEY
jgi:ATPase subunit of ABC transporter with duplicated ATPase domains